MFCYDILEVCNRFAHLSLTKNLRFPASNYNRLGLLNMNILGIETTCDETGVAIVKDGKEILANIVASSVNLHKKYGGVVPEVAAREQVRVMIPVLKEAISKARIPDNKIDAVACAYGPGLIGSLLVGVETAKALALAWDKPLIPINHLLAHVYANWLSVDSSQITDGNRQQLTVNREPQFPLVALIVSGGHTDLVLMSDHGKFRFLGGTRDDAAGEAFDKVARILDLPYPGGPEIEKLAVDYKLPRPERSRYSSLSLHERADTPELGSMYSLSRIHPQTVNPQRSASEYNFKQNKFNLPKPMVSGDNFDFSFSGIKTAVVNLSKKFSLSFQDKTEIAYKFQEAVCEVLVKKTHKAASKYKVRSIVAGGGVAANSELRSRMSDPAKNGQLSIFFPEKELSIDNGAMIAVCAYYLSKKEPPLFLKADPSLHF